MIGTADGDVGGRLDLAIETALGVARRSVHKRPHVRPLAGEQLRGRCDPGSGKARVIASVIPSLLVPVKITQATRSCLCVLLVVMFASAMVRQCSVSAAPFTDQP